MSVTRESAAAAPLVDGRVLVAGGDDGTFPQSSAEVFDPATKSFNSAGIGSLLPPRAGAAAAGLPDGGALVAGSGPTAVVFTLATNNLTFTVQGKRLIVSVQAPGNVSLADAASRLNASTSKKRKRKHKLLKASSASGNPPTITVQLVLTKAAKRRLMRKGRVTVNARITFTGPGGLANTQTAKLKIKGKKRKE
jgi:hypothetical protein